MVVVGGGGRGLCVEYCTMMFKNVDVMINTSAFYLLEILLMCVASCKMLSVPVLDNGFKSCANKTLIFMSVYLLIDLFTDLRASTDVRSSGGDDKKYIISLQLVTVFSTTYNNVPFYDL